MEDLIYVISLEWSWCRFLFHSCFLSSASSVLFSSLLTSGFHTSTSSSSTFPRRLLSQQKSMIPTLTLGNHVVILQCRYNKTQMWLLHSNNRVKTGAPATCTRLLLSLRISWSNLTRVSNQGVFKSHSIIILLTFSISTVIELRVGLSAAPGTSVDAKLSGARPINCICDGVAEARRG